MRRCSWRRWRCTAVRVCGAPGEVRQAGAHHPGRPAGQEAPHGRRGVDRLVGVVVADQIAARAQHPHVAALCVVLAQAETGGLVAPLDDLGPPRAVEVGQVGRREHAVGGEEGPARERRPRGGIEGILLLVERAGHHVGARRLDRAPTVRRGLAPRRRAVRPSQGRPPGVYQAECRRPVRGEGRSTPPLWAGPALPAPTKTESSGAVAELGGRGGRCDQGPGGGRPLSCHRRPPLDAEPPGGRRRPHRPGRPPPPTARPGDRPRWGRTRRSDWPESCRGPTDHVSVKR